MEIKLQAIGFVKNERKEVKDDHWGKIVSEIELVESIMAEALEGIEAFSHLEIIFYMDQVLAEKAVPQYRHPRNNTNLPMLGTFAQRNKNRPNQLGLTTVELIERKERSLFVRKLDAINGTPILDIKPVFKEFEPQGEIRQPDWPQEIMKFYW